MNYVKDIPYKVEKSAIQGLDCSSMDLFNAVVEISNGDNIKYEVHPCGEYLTPVRALNPIFRYPFSYGYIPQTLEEDGDGLDVIIVTPEPLAHLSVVEIRVLGYIPTLDGGLKDTKIVAVPAYSQLRKVSIDKIFAFLKNYKYPDSDSTQVFDYVHDSREAKKLVEEAHTFYVSKNTSDSHTIIEEKPVEVGTIDEAPTDTKNEVKQILKNSVERNVDFAWPTEF